MSKTSLKVARGALVGALVLFLLPAAAGAIQHEVRIYLDLDDDTATGCEVTTVDGPFAGAEQVLITTVETTASPDAGTITDAALAECIDEVTDTFGIPTSFDGNWPVGVGNGEGARDVVETYAPLLSLVIQDPSVVHLGVVVTDEQGGEEALLTVDDTPDGPPIVLDLRSVLEIPTLGEWGLILLALLLAAASVHLMGRRGTAAVGVALLVLATGVAWAAGTLDGLTDDWSVSDQLAANGLVLFGKGAPDQLCFRVDVDLLFNQPPTITNIADQTIPEDGTTGALAFTVGDPESPATSLTVSATSSNQVLVPDGNLTLAGSGANRTIEVTPAADQNGMTDVTVTVEDPDGGTASTTFRVTVTSENDPPTITAIADQTIDEDTSTGPLAFTVGDVETAPGSLSVTASSDDQTIIPDGNLVLGGSGANRTITVTPAADQNGGPVTVTVTVQDSDGGSVPEQFDVTVNPVNDPPTITAIADQTIDEDTSTGALAFTIDDVDDPVGSLTVGATSSDQTLIPDGNLVIGGAAPNLTIEATPAPDENGGPATITVTVTDPSAATGVETFDVTVNPVNDPPTVTNSTISYNAVGNTLLRVPGNDPDHDGGVPGRIASTSDATDAFAKAGPSDIDSASVGFQAGSFATTQSGSLTIDDDGDFHYTPPTGVTGVTDDVVVNVADTEGLTTPVTIEITLSELVWYVEDTTGVKNPAGDTDGRSTDAFETLGAAETASGPGDYILVFETSGALDEGITLKSGQKLYGQPVEDEATPLLPGGLLLEPIDDTGARPVIDFTSGDAVSVPATAGDLVDVEIRHLELSGSDSAIDVTSADTHAVGVTITDNRIADSGAEGIDLNPDSSGAFTATIEDNVFATSSPTGNAIDVTTASTNTAAVEVAINGNTDVTSISGTGTGIGINLNGAQGTGTLFVTGFADNTVHGNTDAAGVMATDVTFDADPSTDAFEEVAAGTWSIGENGNPVGGSGMYLGTTAQEVEGNLSFTQLDVFANGAGLDVAGAGIFTAGPPDTGFQLTIAGGTVEATGGPGVTIDPATLGISFDSVTSTASPTTGISLTNVGGSFSATGGSLATTGVGSGPTFQVSGGSVAATYGGSVASADGHSVQVQNMTGGTVTLNGPVDDDGAGISIAGNDATTSVTFNGGLALTTMTNTAFTATGDGSVTVASAPSNTISTTTGTGVLVNGVDLTGDFDSVTVTNGSGAGISLASTAGTKSFGTLAVTNSNGPGLLAQNAGTIGATGGSITTTSGSAISWSNTAVAAGGITLGSLTSQTTTAGTSGIGVNGASGGLVSVTGTTTIQNIGATGIGIANVSNDWSFASIDVDGTTGVGVQLTNNSGAVTIAGGDISGAGSAGGAAFDVFGGGGPVGYGGSIQNSVGKAVEITGRTGGTVTLSGAITHDDGAGGAVNLVGIDVNGNSGGITTFSGTSKLVNSGSQAAVTLASNAGHTVNFTGGGLDIDTTSGAGFSATVSGTVNVTGGSNTVNTTTGTGVNIANVTIGASDVTFERVSVNGAANGIVLNTTGGNTFEVTGEGASDPSVVVGTRGRTLNLNGGGTMSGLNTGGVIQNTTGDGVSLTNAQAVLRNLTIGDPAATVGQAADGTTDVGDDGVSVSSSGSLTLDNVLISRTATHGIRAVNTSDVTILNSEVLNAGTAVDEHGAFFDELLGTSTITSSIFDGMHSRGILVDNDTKTSALTPDELTIRNTRVSNSDPIAGEIGIHFRSLGSSNFDLVVLDSLITTVEGNGIGVFSNGNNAADPSNAHLEVQRTTITGQASGDIKVPTAIQVNPAFEGNSTFDIRNNNPTDGGGFSDIVTAGIIIKNDSNGLLRGTIDDNDVSSGGEGAFVVADGAIGAVNVTGDVQITLTNNVFDSSGAHGMSFSAQDGAVSLEARIGNNTTTAGGPASSFQNGVFMDVQSGTACFNLATAGGAGNNVATGAGGGEGIWLQKTGGSVNLQGFGGGNDAAAAAFLDANNTSNPAAGVFSGDTVGTGTCSNTP